MMKLRLFYKISIIFFILMVVGVSYGFFVYNKEIANVSLNTGELSLTLSNVNGSV